MEIILSVCLIANPSQCKDQPLDQRVNTADPFHCTVVSTPYVAQWADQHPAWKIIKWRCSASGGRDM